VFKTIARIENGDLFMTRLDSDRVGAFTAGLVFMLSAPSFGVHPAIKHFL
jgi:hypothetical protein